MAHDAQVTLRPASWDATAERWLSLALAGASLADLRHQVENGAALFHIVQADQVVGAFLLRVDHTPSGAEGVIVAFAADAPGLDVLALCGPSVEAMFSGVRRYRFHTARPGLVRKLLAQGYAPREFVCYKEKT